MRARIRRLVRGAKIGWHQRLKRRSDGPDLDLNAALDAAIAMRAVDLPEDRVFRTMARRQRDLAVTILLDVSESTRDRVAAATLRCSTLNGWPWRRSPRLSVCASGLRVCRPRGCTGILSQGIQRALRCERQGAAGTVSTAAFDPAGNGSSTCRVRNRIHAQSPQAHPRPDGWRAIRYRCSRSARSGSRMRGARCWSTIAGHRCLWCHAPSIRRRLGPAYSAATSTCRCGGWKI